MTEWMDPADPKYADDYVPDEKKPGKRSPRLFTIAVKRDALGWRMMVCRVPESTLDNHVSERFEPEMFDLVIARIERKLRELVMK